MSDALHRGGTCLEGDARRPEERLDEDIATDGRGLRRATGTTARGVRGGERPDVFSSS